MQDQLPTSELTPSDATGGLIPDGLSFEAIMQDAGVLAMGLLVAGIIVGAILFLMGRKIARPACSIGGLVIGGVGVAGVFQLIGADQWILFGLIGGAIIFFVVAWALFRLWMGLSCAIILATVAPVVAIIIQGGEQNVADAVNEVDTQAFNLDPEAIKEDLQKDLTEWGRRELNMSGENALDGGIDEDEMASKEEVRAALREKLQAVVQPIREQITLMWENLGDGGRTTILIAGGVGAIIGLIFGLIFPYGAAVLQTALVGAWLGVVCALGLAYANIPQHMARVDLTPRLFLLVLGLITVHGIGIQWTLFGRKVDKK